MSELTPELVNAIGDAFNANDIDTVMPFFAANAIFDHAVGPEPLGIRFEGADAIRRVFTGLFNKVETVHWKTLDCRIIGDKAYCEYLRTAKHKDGSNEEFCSVDILTFQDGLITHKDTYYKQRAL